MAGGSNLEAREEEAEGGIANALFAAEEYPEVEEEEEEREEGEDEGGQADSDDVLDYEDVTVVDEEGKEDVAAGGENNRTVEQEGGAASSSEGNVTEVTSSSNGTEETAVTSRYSSRKVDCLRRVQNEDEATESRLEEAENESDPAEDEDDGKEGGEGDEEEDSTLDSAAPPAPPGPRHEVQLVNGSHFLQLLSEQNDSNVTNRSSPALCSLGFFYASWCPFSAAAAPHFNALPRVFPDVSMFAVDTSRHHGINTQFGIMALPTVILFHNSKPVAKYNLTEYEVGHFSRYVTFLTGLEPAEEPGLRQEDLVGPVPTREVPVPDYYLYLAWAFALLCALGYFVRSALFRSMVESVRRAWREAEIHHEHED